MDAPTEGTLTAAVLAETTDTTIDTVERLAAVDVKVLRRILTASIKNSRRMFLDEPPA